nr:RICIN domain-containing protein [Actinoplanes globisporus]
MRRWPLDGRRSDGNSSSGGAGCLHSMSNPTTGRCIDAPSGATANGTRLQIWDCNGSGAQKFALA